MIFKAQRCIKNQERKVMKTLPLYAALDLSSEEQALAIAKQTAPYVEGFKLGPRLLLKNAEGFIKKIRNFTDKKIFLDFKFFDIPSTMLASVQSAYDIGADMVTVHAQAGEKALRELASLEQKLKSKRDFRILAVTVLTSFSQNSLPLTLRSLSISKQVEILADLAVQQGLNSLVCSGYELKFLRKKYPKMYLMVPGVRLNSKTSLQSATSSSVLQDQKRIITPEEALKAGASALVIGRPIYQSQNPAQVCASLQKSLKTP